jgi:bacteriocin-like protein
MKNAAFGVSSWELSKVPSNVSSGSKNQFNDMIDHEFLTDEELATISGGTGSGTDWNFLDDTINAVSDFFARIYNAGEDAGDSISDYKNRNVPC